MSEMILNWTKFVLTYKFCNRNPTPETSPLPKWETVKGFPVNYYRIGNFHFEDKAMFGMENGGLFEDRTKFWRDLAAFSSANPPNKGEL